MSSTAAALHLPVAPRAARPPVVEGSLVTDGASVAAIGGFSGQESQVSAAWLADAVEAGNVRWVLTESSGGFGGQDGRVGSTAIMAVVQRVGTEVSSVSGLYDLQGKAAALRARGLSAVTRASAAAGERAPPPPGRRCGSG